MSPSDLDRLRRQSVGRLVIGAALGSIPFFAAVSAAPVAAHRITGSESIGGIAVAALSVGTGLGALSIGRFMAARGRRAGLVLAYLVACFGALLSIGGITAGSVALLIAGLVALGVGHSANNLARYVAAELAPERRRGSAVGLVVWAATVGAVIGPNVLTSAGKVATGLGLQELVGTFALGLVLYGFASAFYFVRLRPEPSTIAVEDLGAVAEAGRTVSAMLATRRVQVALLALALSQFVMVLVMSMTPVHITSSGHEIGVVGLVLSSHFIGMYALSPLSGWIADRFGKMRAIWSGFGVLLVAVVSVAATQSSGGLLLAGPLFLVGLGWSMSFVSGSALVSEGLPYADRARLQGAVDTLVWTCSALAAVSGGVLLGAFGYPMLTWVGSVAVACGALVMRTRYRDALVQTAG